MFAIQYEIGMADGVANGNFGPGTQAGLQAQGSLSQGSTDSTKYFVHLFQAALTFNGYPTSYDGVFSAGTKAQTQAFQTFCKLAVSGNADFQTWASLLVSTGDVNRPGTAVDCITTITTPRAQTLYSNGYRIVGRYLTNTPVADPLDKNIKPGELATIFANNLKVFPIFQEGGTDLTYFTNSKGLSAGQRAYDAAIGYGFKRGTTIYFAVDFDVVEDEVYAYIVPYFQGIRKAISDRGDYYRVGIYASRNTCSIVSNQGLAELSFVSGMSTGYSGNLGFPLPRNWAFDQILEYTIGSGTGEIGIDKDIASGLDAGQSAVDAPATGLDVTLPSNVLTAWSLDVSNWLTGKMNIGQKEIAIRSRFQVTQLGIDHDALITSLARGYRMRKSFIQTVLLWEAAVESVIDVGGDLEVQATYASIFAGGPTPPVMVYDSSTGPCQIFAKTAIEAINWARTKGLTSLPARSLSNQADMWTIWLQLHNDEEFNLTMAALVLLKAAADKSVTNVLNPSAVDVQAVLGKYNGEPQYGVDNYPLYQLLEGYNAAAR
jgi:peptidoglycan hydrolase-like protein with peptidoglycan-binding domain